MPLLLLCGDIEQNPGPSPDEMLNEILVGQKLIQKRLDAIEAKLQKVEESALKCVEIGTKITNLERTVLQLERKLVDLEDRSRRNNLIVFGMQENEDETPESLAKGVTESVFQKTLGVTVTSVERIHRMGRKQADKPRPVILKLIDHREKINVLKNCHKFKGGRISVSEDFSVTTRQIRKHLWESTSDARSAGSKVRLVYDKIKIDSDFYEWDSTKKQRVPVARVKHDSERSD